MTDTPSIVPAFEFDGVTFRCWITDDGVNELGIPAKRHEWRSVDGRCRAGRNSGNAMSWSSVDGRMFGIHFQSTRLAMQAAVRVTQRRAA